MDCRQIESQLAMLSADALPAATVLQVREHLTQCKHCEQEWMLLQTTMSVLSTSTQIMPSPEQSEQLWQRCSEQIHEKIEQRRLASQKPSWLGWMRNQPRLGWVALGSAVAVLGGVWWLGPQETADGSPDGYNANIAQVLPGQAIMPPPHADGIHPGQLVTFQRPSALASSMVSNHTGFAFDPFIDHVGTTVVSYSAMSPAGTAPAIDPAAVPQR